MSSSKYFNSYCVLIIWILALAGSGSACSGGDEDKYRIVRKTDEGDKQLVVATEETAKMYCRTNVPWKKCWWKPPRNGVRQLKCEFTKGPGNMVTCPSFPEIHYDKQTSDLHQHNCAIIVENIQEHHEGKWKCEFEIDAPNEDDPNEPVIVKESVKLLARGYRYV